MSRRHRRHERQRDRHDADTESTGCRPSRRRLYRDPENGILFGVAAGIADHLGVRPFAVRAALVIAAFPFTFPVVIGYLVAGFVLKPKPADLYRSEAEAVFWRGMRTEPRRTAHDLSLKFADIERRLRRAEAHVTSREFRLRREIGEL